ncbi:MAG TPA: glutamine--fructose-6-phosphate transaminase (isomerizing) [Thermomicrobiales bacterium]|nr:glutamine--fructose-6-phosphate transaminase (isomerizing) [Thermomicrobiales bacterium]
MCGIFGYVGAPIEVGPVVLAALQSMEYRGYDSWGTAFSMTGEPGRIIKRVGRVDTEAAVGSTATSAIGHTRWATHGEVCERNAHPHLALGGRIAIVHNGIIENADRLREELPDAAEVVSDTDSELMAHLVAMNLERQFSLRDAVQCAFMLMEGNNAFVVLDRVTGEVVVVARRLPIRLARTERALILASDPAALAGMVEATVAVPDDTAVSLGTPLNPSPDALAVLRRAKQIPVPAGRTANGSGPGAAMRAEIGEQPEVLRRISRDRASVDPAAVLARRATRLVFTGCGSASHAAMYGADLLADMVRHPDAVAVPASEILGRPSIIRPGDVMVVLTQSGETADVIDAVAVARERRVPVVGLINAEGSSVESLVDVAVPLLAGHERSVLATKSYMAMLGRLWQLVRSIAGCEGEVAMEQTADALQRTLDDRGIRNWVAGLANTLADRSSAMVVTSGAHMPVALEAALKVKEGSYVHAEAVRTGELKHGVIALVDDGFPCVLMTPDGEIGARLRIAAEELRSRGAAVYWCGPQQPSMFDRGQAAHAIDARTPFEQTMIMQMVALETALSRSVDPDYPRNLAKSVTVR